MSSNRSLLNRMFRELVKRGTETEIKDFYASHEAEVDLDDKDPETGRVALHLANFRRNVDIIQLLIKFGANENLRDAEGALPVEIYYSQRQPQLDPDKDYTPRYREFFVSEANQRLEAARAPGRLVYITDITQVNPFIESHPELERIGFIVLIPNCLRDETALDTHTSPIYFERHGNNQIFVQFDSANTFHFIIPSSKNPIIQRRLFYCPFSRQVAGKGCFNDAIILLMKMIKEGHMLEFCEQYSKELPKSRYLQYTSGDEARYRYLFNGTQKEFDDEFPDVFLRRNYHAQLNVLLFLNLILASSDQLLQLTSLPPLALSHIENFRTMRHFRVKETKKVESELKTILRYGRTRDAYAMTDGEFKKHLGDEDKKYDIQGRSFIERYYVFNALCTAREKLYKGYLTCKLNETDAAASKAKASNPKAAYQKLKSDETRKVANHIIRFLLP